MIAKLFAVGALALLGGLTAPTHGADLVGTVRGPDGEAIAGVYVTVRDVSQRYAATAFSDDHGEYALTGLAPGFYQILAGGRGLVAITVESFRVGESGASLDIPYLDEMGPPVFCPDADSLPLEGLPEERELADIIV